MTDEIRETGPAQQEQRQGTAEIAAQLGDDHHHAEAPPANASEAPLFPAETADGMRRRWQDVQASFVDEPRRAVEQADELVATAIKQLAEIFATERAQLEQQWDQGDQVSTEDLRLALQKYRSFFGRLLAV